MFVTLNEVLRPAKRHGYAVGAFNVYNLETAKTVLQTAVNEQSPVILATSESAIEYAGITNISALLLDMGRRAPIPVVVHLDHGKHEKTVKDCLAYEYTSVMFDASSLPEKEKIIQTRALAQIAHRHDASIEGERDSIGGREDYIKGKENDFSNPQILADFVKQTDIDAVAVSIGNVHGAPLPMETLNIELLEKIREQVSIPLVLHGASGTPAPLIRKAIAAGICKINIDTDLRLAFMEEVRQILSHNHHMTDPRDLLTEAQESIARVVRSKIRLFGSVGRA